MSTLQNIRYSILDLATLNEGQTPASTFINTKKIAQQAEKSGYYRYWFTEHHNMVSVASASPPVLISYVAAHTKKIRVGSGGMMLPNHAPLIVAEQFGTLESLYPGRIDLGLGRAPGADQITAMAIRGKNFMAQQSFPADVEQIRLFFSSENAGAQLRAIPGEGTDLPVYILGSSFQSADLAATMGLPYAFASHFAPAELFKAVRYYREHFKPSKQLDKPYVIAGINVVGADTDDEAELLSSSAKRMFFGVITGNMKPLMPPALDFDSQWSYAEKEAVKNMLFYMFAGSAAKLKREVTEFVEQVNPDELIVSTHIYDFDAKLKFLQDFCRAF